jgi:HprK-related kinase A
VVNLQESLVPSLLDPGVQVTVGPFLVRLRSELGEVQAHLQHLYGDFPKREGDEGHFDIAVVGGRGVHRLFRRQSRVIINGVAPFLPLPRQLAGPSIEWALNWCIGKNTHRWIAVHSAVVERNGSILMLPGPSGSGKSTLCASLTGEGWRLFSDEFALIDPVSSLVFPIPRPISLKNRAIEIIRLRYPQFVFGPEARDTEGSMFVHMRPPLESVRRAGEAARVRWVIVPRFIAGASTTLERLPRARALMHVTDQSFNYNYLGAKGFQCLADMIREADCYRLEYGDLDDVLALIQNVTAG